MSFLSSSDQRENSGEEKQAVPKSIHDLRKNVLMGVLLVFALYLGGMLISHLFSDTNEQSVRIDAEEEVAPPDPVVESQAAVQQANPFPDDYDRDGISNAEEEALGLNQFEFDTDGDGLNDIDEIERWKTDPNNSDTDGDGYADGYEILNGYSPLGEGSL